MMMEDNRAASWKASLSLLVLVLADHPDSPSSFRQVSVTHDSVTLEWIPSFNGGLEQRFRIRYHWDQSVSFLYVDVFPPDATTFTVTGLQPNTTYSFSVNALNAIGESNYADDNAVLTITTKEKPESEGPTAADPLDQGFPTYLTVVFTVVFGVLLVVNSLGCYFGKKWRNRRDKTMSPAGAGEGSVVNRQKSEEDRSSQSNSNKYESREKINAAAQRTLIIDSGSETDSNAYESYTTENSHYYYPTDGYKPSLRPHPEEQRHLDVIPLNYEHHLYEDVRDWETYQDMLPSSLPFLPFSSDHRLTLQRTDWRTPTHPQDAEETGKFMTVQQSHDYDLPFEMRGELV